MKKLLKIFEPDIYDIQPIWLMRQAGRYLPEYRKMRSTQKDFLSMCYNPKVVRELTMQPIERFNFDGAILFSDILVIPDALGVKVNFIKGTGPIVEKVTEQKVRELDIYNIEKHLKSVSEAIKLLKFSLKKYPDTALIGFSGSPWTLAVYMIEGISSKNFIESKSFAYNNKEAFTELMDILVRSISDYLSMQVESGVEILQLFDSWSGVLTESQFRDWVINPTREIVADVKSKHPDIKIIGFPRGPSLMLEEYFRDTGVDGISIDYTTPISHAVDLAKKYNKVIQGNLDPALLTIDNQEILKQEIDKILTVTKDVKHIFNLGHGISPEAKVDNVEYLLDMIRKN